MIIKAALIDFDGTLVTRSMLDFLCSLVGKERKSKKIGTSHAKGISRGLSPLVKRINLLKRLSITKINNELNKNNYLRDGAVDFFRFLRENKIITILHSGNILPVLDYYREKLKIDYIVGSNPVIKNNKIDYIKEKSYSGVDFKLTDSKIILKKLNINSNEVVALGDSPSDKIVFEFAQISIAVHPLFGIEKFADYVIRDNLSRAIPILKKIIKN